ncbi:hypothetical protein QBC35DRAFT_40742 [Podospora australis]|uniref:Uncharacterized protein n=1 Tax=Podospora australis TaxID=1536484 RepID=A0AAN6WN75_9PEZI|nr:hypothetical protein QBC35DRAFT_40742 [Podospora australis]
MLLTFFWLFDHIPLYPLFVSLLVLFIIFWHVTPNALFMYHIGYRGIIGMKREHKKERDGTMNIHPGNIFGYHTFLGILGIITIDISYLDRYPRQRSCCGSSCVS